MNLPGKSNKNMADLRAGLRKRGAFLNSGCFFHGKTNRGRKMSTNFFCTNFLNTPRGPGHPSKIPGTSQVPPQGRQTFEGGHELFDPHPFAWKTPTPPGGLRTPKLNLCALLSCLGGRGLRGGPIFVGGPPLFVTSPCYFQEKKSGISKPMVCQTYGLGAGRLSRKRRESRKRRKRRRRRRQLQTRS